jgi:cell division protein FtsQ
VSELGATDGESASSGPNYVKQLSEVDLSDPENVKVTANDPGGTMVVHLGKEDFLPRYKLYVTHIAEWRQQFQNVQSVDLRFEGQVVVNPDQSPKSPGSPSSPKSEKPKAAVLKPVSAKAAAKPKTVKAKKNSPQRTQRAQR